MLKTDPSGPQNMNIHSRRQVWCWGLSLTSRCPSSCSSPASPFHPPTLTHRQCPFLHFHHFPFCFVCWVHSWYLWFPDKLYSLLTLEKVRERAWNESPLGAFLFSSCTLPPRTSRSCLRPAATSVGDNIRQCQPGLFAAPCLWHSFATWWSNLSHLRRIALLQFLWKTVFGETRDTNLNNTVGSAGTKQLLSA